VAATMANYEALRAITALRNQIGPLWGMSGMIRVAECSCLTRKRGMGSG